MKIVNLLVNFVGGLVFLISSAAAILSLYTNAFTNTYPEDRGQNALELSGGGFVFNMTGKAAFVLAILVFISAVFAWFSRAEMRGKLVILGVSFALFLALALVPNLPTPGSYARSENFFFMKQFQPRIPGITGESSALAQWYTLTFRVILLVLFGAFLVLLEKSKLGLISHYRNAK